ncbi:MAG TPA: hypothetical protein VF719_12700 [Abditibacteriaceae bacterium]|jgi:hypothetical protein
MRQPDKMPYSAKLVCGVLENQEEHTIRASGYSADIFIPNDEDTSTETVNVRLIGCVQSQNPERIGTNEKAPTSNDSYTGYWPNWSLTLVMADAPHVAEESQELAECNSFRPPFDTIGKCKRRIEVWSDPDPNMDYFNVYIGLLEQIEQQLAGAILTDENGPM